MDLPEAWVISARPAHPALVGEADYIAVQNLAARRGPSSPAGRTYILAGLVRCGICGRLLESCWSNGRAAYRCRHGHRSADAPDPARPRNSYIREDQILPQLPALDILMRGQPAATAVEVIGRLRASGTSITYDPYDRTLRIGTAGAVTVDRSR